MNQKNGNAQLNSERERVNERTEKLSGVGCSKRIIWRKKRRHRAI